MSIHRHRYRLVTDPSLRPRFPPSQAAAPGQGRGVGPLCFGQALSCLGMGFSFLALPLLTLNLTGSAAWLAGVSAALSMPTLVLALAGGAIADLVDRRKLLISCDVGRLTVTALVPLTLAISSHPLLARIFLVTSALGLGALNGLFQAGLHAVLPQLVRPSELDGANATLSVAENVAWLGGPALAGLLVNAASVVWAFEVDAATYCFSVASLVWLSRSLLMEASDRGVKRRFPREVITGVRSGVAFAWQQRTLRSLLSLWFFILLGSGSFFELVAYRLRHELDRSAAAVGFVFASAAAGAVIGPLTVLGRRRAAGRAPQSLGARWLAVLAALLSGLAYLAMAGSRSTLAFALLGAAAQAVLSGAAVSSRSLGQRLAPATALGRVVGVGYATQWGGITASLALTGAVMSLWGASPAFALLGGELLAVGILWAAATRLPLGRKRPGEVERVEGEIDIDPAQGTEPRGSAQEAKGGLG